MAEFLDKISSYDLFNNLLPGAVFCVVVDKLFHFSLVQNDVLSGLFFYYFIGVLVGRFGSLVVEPILKSLKVIVFAPYSDFLSAENADPKVSILSEVNNMYRSLLSLSVIALILWVLSEFNLFKSFIDSSLVPAVLIGLIVLLVFSYRKQTGFVRSRVEKNIQSLSDGEKV